MAYSQASTVRKALAGMGLIGSDEKMIHPDLSAKRKAAGLASAEAKRRKKLGLDKPAEQQPEQPVLLPVANQQVQQVQQTIQQENVNEARRILNDAGPKAAKYLSDLVSGAIPDASERLRLEAAKVILASQGATGEQQSGNSRQDINSMSKHDLMAFIHAGTVELNRIKAAREVEIIDVQLDS